MINWYWAIRTKKYKTKKDETVVVACFRHKKDAKAFRLASKLAG